MSRTDHQPYRHKRGWLLLRHMELAKVTPKLVREAIEDGKIDAEERNHCDGPNGPCDWCMSQPEE